MTETNDIELSEAMSVMRNEIEAYLKKHENDTILTVEIKNRLYHTIKELAWSIRLMKDLVKEPIKINKNVSKIKLKCPKSLKIDKKQLDVIDKENWDFYAGGELGQILCFTCGQTTGECCSFSPTGKLTNCPF
jgi:hypothetical protein